MSDNINDQSFSGAGMGRSERPDTDLSGMDPGTAQEYVISFITALKTTQKQKKSLLEERNLWQERVVLAQSKEQTELALKAQNRVSEIQAKITTLETEEKDLEQKVAILKTELQKLAQRTNLSVDVDGLLAQLEMLVGEPDKTKEAFKEEEAQAELERLKKKLEQEKEGS
jgi:phage shock protein A